jgi:transcriptional regulator GlxA family with amidase domain
MNIPFMKYRNHLHTGIHEVQDYVQENISQKILLAHLADVACMSARNLTRTFKKETGITVNNYVTLVRKELLKQLSQQQNITRKQMAVFSGLKSERHVIRLLKNNHH